MSDRIVSDEIYKLIEDETSSFRNLTSGYIIENYKLGVSDLILRFYDNRLHIIKNGELIQQKKIVDIRSRLLSSYFDDACKKYPELMSKVDVFIPVCFSDTSDTPLQEIPCLVFSKTAFSNNILIPSPNNFIGHWEVERINAGDAPLHTKDNKICFVGSLTGNMERPEDNMRLRTMSKLSETGNSFCRLLRPPGVPEDAWQDMLSKVKTLYPSISEENILNEHVKLSIEEQLVYKYQICVDGHSCAWARLPWQMSANCVPLKVRNHRHNWMEWFYPLLKPNKHFLELDIEELNMAYEYLESNPQAQMDISESGKQFVRDYCHENLALDVFAQTLLLLSKKQNNQLYVRAEKEASGEQEIRRV